MSKYADWSPASVFGSTEGIPSSCNAYSTLPSPVEPPKPKKSPKKRDPLANSLPQNELTSNNNEECKERSNTVQQPVPSDVRVERKKRLAALLLQRQVQVWLLRRQETQRGLEVQRLRQALCQAAACVIGQSYRRYVKRRAMNDYLYELGNFEARVDDLLQRCISRKRQIEEVQRFATLRRLQKQQREDQQRAFVHGWLKLRIQSRCQKREQIIVKAHEKIIGCVRRWTLQKRCEARIIARDKEKEIESQRQNCAQTIFKFYRAYKLRRRAKDQVRQRRRLRDGYVKLFSTLQFAAVRIAVSRWHERVYRLKMEEGASIKFQRVYRKHRAAISHVRRIESCKLLQRMARGHMARIRSASLRQNKLREALDRERHLAAIMIQRRVRGHLTRVWFGEVLCKLRERFKCANCGAIEPGGTYCKFCGRHRSAVNSLPSVLLMHEKWRLGKSPSQSLASKAVKSPTDDLVSLPLVSPSPKKPAIQRSRSASLRLRAASSSNFDALDSIISLPMVLSPLHRRLVPHNVGGFARSKSLPPAQLAVLRRNSISSISEQTALRATALATLQTNITASAQASALEQHLTRLQTANKAVHRSTTHY